MFVGLLPTSYQSSGTLKTVQKLMQATVLESAPHLQTSNSIHYLPIARRPSLTSGGSEDGMTLLFLLVNHLKVLVDNCHSEKDTRAAANCTKEICNDG